MVQNEYELIYIIRPDIDDATTNDVVEKVEGVITDGGGTLLERDDWGSRKLAYPVRGHYKGHYVQVDFIAEPGLIAELERRIRITDPIIRFLTVKRFEDVEVDSRLAETAEERRLREEQAAAEAEEESQASA